MKKIYVSIPITGENYNDQRNHAFIAATNLAQKGYDVITPFDIVSDCTTPYDKAMGKCIEELLKCDAIYMCIGWEQSKGCKAELQTALIYGLKVITENN